MKKYIVAIMVSIFVIGFAVENYVCKESAHSTPIETSQTEEGNDYIFNGKVWKIVQTYTDKVYYNDFETLEAASQVIVIGKFIDDATQEIYRRYDPYWEMDVIYNGISTNTFQVERVLKGDIESDTIKISQRYIVDDTSGTIISFGEMVPMEKDSEWIYFLNYYEDEGVYWTVGDYTGRYPNKDINNVDVVKSSEIGVYNTDLFIQTHEIYNDLIEEYNIKFD